MSDENSDCWYLFDGGRVSGPFPKSEINQKLVNGLSLDTLIWNHQRAAWETMGRWVKLQGPAPSWDDVWYALSEGLHCGPFTLQQITEKLKLGELHGTSKLWREGQTKWISIHEFPEIVAGAGLKSRRFPRVPFVGLAQVSGLRRESKVATLSLSLGGLSITQLPNVDPGAKLNLRVSSDLLLYPFEARVKVVYQHKDISGLEFQTLPPSSEDIVREYVKAFSESEK